MKLLITGSAGLIGSALHKFFQTRFNVCGLDVLKTDTVDYVVDISSVEKLRIALEEIKPDIIIHAAVIKSLVACEKERQLCWSVNTESTIEIVRFAKESAAKVIYISSDMVFDGKKGDYSETDEPHPINWYGTTKHSSEEELARLENSAICRTAFVFWDLTEKDKDVLKKEILSEVLDNQSLFPYYVFARLMQGKLVRLSDTTISSPTTTLLLQKGIERIIDRSLAGIFHIASCESTSRYKLGLAIATLVGADPSLIIKDESVVSELRPKDLSLNVGKTYKLLDINPSDLTIEKLLLSLNLDNNIITI